MPKALVIPADGPVVLKDLPNYSAIKAELSGGWLEALTGYMHDAVAYIDEDGKGKSLPYNNRATGFARKCIGLWPHDFIVGTMILFGSAPGEDGYEEADVPSWIVAFFQQAGELP